MGYQISFTLTKDELDSKFVPLYKDINKLNAALSEEKLSLMLYAMLPPKDMQEQGIVRDANFRARGYILLLEDLAKHRIYDDIAEKGEVEFYGWNCARPEGIDRNSIIESLTEDICTFKCLVPTPDYFEDNEKFCEKRNDIMERLDLEEIIFDSIYSEFHEMYYDKSDEAQLKKEESYESE